MRPFRKRTKPRRLEVRRGAAPAGPSTWQRFRRARGGPAVVVALVFLAGAGALDLWPIDPFPYTEGQYVPEDVRARVTFETVSEDLRDKAIDLARNTTPATFHLDETFVNEILAELGQMPDRLQGKQLANFEPSFRHRFGITSEPQLRRLQAYARGQAKTRYQAQLGEVSQRMMDLHVVLPSDLEKQRNRTAAQARFVSPKGSQAVNVRHILTSAQTDRISDRVTVLTRDMDGPVRECVRAYLQWALSRSLPVYLLDAATTEADIRAAVNAQKALTHKELHLEGQVLVRATRRGGEDDEPGHGLRPRELDLLRAEHQAYQAAEAERGPWHLRFRLAGRLAVLIVLVGFVMVYSVRYRPDVTRGWGGLKLAITILVLLAVAKATGTWLGWNRHAAAGAVVVGAMIVTVAFDARYALAIGTMLAVLIALQTRHGLDMLVVLLASMSVAIFLVREVRTRGRLIVVSACAALAAAASVWAVALSRGVPWRFALEDCLWAGGSAVLAGLIAQGFLPLVERLFGVATSMTMLEWCDASKPLLKRLSLEAPGTFNHSLQLGAMCEAAAEAIDADGLRARVGAYYHDVGKINKPQYFVENQDSRHSKHDSLSPAMSLLIIRGHVKDGVELAREYGLPRTLHEFIATHHGTTLVQYFYHAAAEQTKAQQQPAPDEAEYRYPGPKPRTREAGILLLADAAESSVRAMPEPAPSRIEARVHQVVQQRLGDGQLDECELTLRQVHRIERSLVKTLCGMYHARIAYPSTSPPKAGEDNGHPSAPAMPASAPGGAAS